MNLSIETVAKIIQGRDYSLVFLCKILMELQSFLEFKIQDKLFKYHANVLFPFLKIET